MQIRFHHLGLAAVLAFGACTDSGSTATVQPPSAGASSLSFQPTTVVADGITSSTLTIQLRDANGNGVPGATVVVTLVGGGGTVTQPDGATNANGVTTASVLPTRAGALQFSFAVTFGGQTTTLEMTDPLTVVHGDLDPSRSSVVLQPTTAVADGSDSCTVQVRLVDRFDNPIADTAATLTLDGADATLGATDLTTDANGEATTTLTATRFGDKVVGVEAGTPAVTLTHPATAVFTAIVAQDESEPNDQPGEAMPLSLGTAAYGTVGTANDIDFWSVHLNAGEVVAIDVFGTRFDQENWSNSDTVPRVAVWNADGSTKLVEHDPNGEDSANEWYWDWKDVDIPRFVAETTGTYLVSITQAETGSDGGAYALMVRPLDFAPMLGEGSTITATSRVYGFHADTDNDQFTIHVTERSIVSIDLMAYRLGVRHDGAANPDYYDSYLYLAVGGPTDGGSDEISNDDNSFYDSGLAAVVEPGIYTMTVSEYPNSADAPYFADVVITPVGTATESEPNGDFPSATPLAVGTPMNGACELSADVDMFAVELEAGDLITVEYYSPNSTLPTPVDPADVSLELYDPQDNSVPLDWSWGKPSAVGLATQTGTYHVELSTGSPSRQEYVLRITKRATGRESEPNDEVGNAISLQPQQEICGLIGQTDDLDVYAFTVTQPGQLVAFSVLADMNEVALSGRSTLGSSLWTKLTIRDAEGAPLAMSDTDVWPYAQSVVHGEAGAEIAFRAPAAGTYYVGVADSYGTGSDAHFYVLKRTN